MKGSRTLRAVTLRSNGSFATATSSRDVISPGDGAPIIGAHITQPPMRARPAIAASRTRLKAGRAATTARGRRKDTIFHVWYRSGPYCQANARATTTQASAMRPARTTCRRADGPRRAARTRPVSPMTATQSHPPTVKASDCVPSSPRGQKSAAAASTAGRLHPACTWDCARTSLHRRRQGRDCGRRGRSAGHEGSPEARERPRPAPAQHQRDHDRTERGQQEDGQHHVAVGVDAEGSTGDQQDPRRPRPRARELDQTRADHGDGGQAEDPAQENCPYV